MPVTKNKTQTKIFDAGMALLRFLIVDNTDVLKIAIGQLDSFPKLIEFEELSRIQSNVKYNGKEFTLLDEIEYFLAVDKRKVEGLLSLKEYVSISVSNHRQEDIFKSYEIHCILYNNYSYRRIKVNCKEFTNQSTTLADFRKIAQKVPFIA